MSELKEFLDALEEATLKTACPVCEAIPGEACRNIATGMSKRATHTARVRKMLNKLDELWADTAEAKPGDEPTST